MLIVSFCILFLLLDSTTVLNELIQCSLYGVGVVFLTLSCWNSSLKLV